MSLSLWRIYKPNRGLEAFFIACATINSLYCIFWDLYYDWSKLLYIFVEGMIPRDGDGMERH